MKRQRSVEVRVGVFVIVSLLIGGTLAFVIGNQRNLFRSKTQYNAVFESVGGLRPGSPIRIAGVDVGTVGAVRLGEDGLIHVELGIVQDATHLVREDSVATIGNKGLLGDKLVDISVGAGEPLPPGGTIPTESPTDISEYLSQAGGILRNVEGTAENLREATEPLGDDQFGNDLKSVTRNLAEITRLMVEEDGSVNRLLTDDEMARRLEGTLRNTEQASAELTKTMRSARLILDEVRTGDGSAHEIIYGPEGARLVTNLADVTGEAAVVLRDVRTGDGLAHDILYEDTGEELIQNMTQMSADLRDIVADIRAGRGTIGGFLTDPSIYEDVKRLVGDLQRNEILRALVRYSISQDESQGDVDVTPTEDPPEE